MKEQIDRILGKLQYVRERGLKCFGCEAHGFRLNPPLSESAVAAFENQHGIRLPEDYRQFLLHAGNGGAGPHYGLLPLEQWNMVAGNLSQPCPLHPDMSQEENWVDDLGCSEEECWEECYQGAIAIVVQGCGLFCLLIVSGSARGRVVYIDLNGPPPYFVENKDFLSWYERWLDELLAGYDDFRFGVGMAGTEADFLAVLCDPYATTDRRRDAIGAMWRLPQLSDASIQALMACLRDDNPRLRAQAASVLGKCKVVHATDALLSLLKDGEPSVRLAALSALTRLPAVSWSQKARAMLEDQDSSVVEPILSASRDTDLYVPHSLTRLIRTSWTTLSASRDPDPNVRLSAIQCSRDLIEAKVLSPEDVILLLRAGSAEIRSTAAHALGQMGALSAVEPLLGALEDSDCWVRISAIRSLGHLRSHEAVPALSRVLGSENDTGVLINAIRAIVSIGDRAAVPALIEISIGDRTSVSIPINTPEPSYAEVRHVAVWALGELGDERAIPALKALLNDKTQKKTDECAFPIASSIYRLCDHAKMALRKIQRR
jgi:HEAT repeat protein